MANDLGTHGVFSALGQSDAVRGGNIVVVVAFAGTATVALEVQMPSGAWAAVKEFTASEHYLLEGKQAHVKVRLNCTAYTNDVEYMISRADLG